MKRAPLIGLLLAFAACAGAQLPVAAPPKSARPKAVAAIASDPKRLRVELTKLAALPVLDERRAPRIATTLAGVAQPSTLKSLVVWSFEKKRTRRNPTLGYDDIVVASVSRLTELNSHESARALAELVVDPKCPWDGALAESLDEALFIIGRKARPYLETLRQKSTGETRRRLDGLLLQIRAK